MKQFDTGTDLRACLRLLNAIQGDLEAKERKLDESEPAKAWMKQLIGDIGWLISALPENAKSYEIVDSISDFKFKCAAYHFIETVGGDEARFMIRRCYSSSDFSVQEYVILIDTTPDRDFEVFEALRAFGDGDSEDF
jgi:hypothetical protein